LSNYFIFDKQFITYIVILYNHNSFTELKNFRWSWPLKSQAKMHISSKETDSECLNIGLFLDSNVDML